MSYSNKRKKRTQNQKIGEQGEDWIRHIISDSEDWIVRGIEKDYGVDIDIELEDDKIVTGKFIKLQVRTSENLKVSNGVVQKNIEKSLLSYAFYCRIPILLVLVDYSKKVGYYVWLQEWIEENQFDESYFYNEPASVTIKIPHQKQITKGLERDLKNIALGQSHTQLFLDLRFAVKTALFNLNYGIADRLTDIFIELGNRHPLSANLVIDQVITLGTKVWGSHEGNHAAALLYNLCKNYGMKLTVTQIEKITTRGEQFSRTGIVALGILYNKFPDYIKSLDLPNLFSRYQDPRLKYYCDLREKYLGIESSQLFMGKTDFRIGNYTLNIEDDNLFNKWANRGDSIIFDYFEIVN